MRALGVFAPILLYAITLGCGAPCKCVIGFDAGDDAGNSSTTDAGTPECVPQNGVYRCLGLTLLVCPSEAQSGVRCDNTVPLCMYCYQGAGYTCSCADGGFASPMDAAAWLCIGTGSTCR